MDASAISAIALPKFTPALSAIALTPSCKFNAVFSLTLSNLWKSSFIDAILSVDWPVLWAIIAISAATLPLGILPVASDAICIASAIFSAEIPANCNWAAPYPTPPKFLPNKAVLDAAWNWAPICDNCPVNSAIAFAATKFLPPNIPISICWLSTSISPRTFAISLSYLATVPTLSPIRP